MGILIALLPALFWGSTPIWVHYLGGKPISQLLGTTYGAIIIGLLVFLIKRPDITPQDWFWCVLGGACWSLGQLAQYHAYNQLGVSTTAPVNSGIQLIGVNSIGVLCFGSWASTRAKVIGFCAVALVIIGVFISTRTGQKVSVKNKKQSTIALIKLILGSGIGYTACSTLPRIPNAQGWVTFPPQTVGMIIGAVVLTLLEKRNRHWETFFGRYAIENTLEGFNSGLGTFFYLVSMMMVGVSTSFTLSQMSPVISTMAGLTILHERKNHRALAYTLIGLASIVIGGIMTGTIH